MIDPATNQATNKVCTLGGLQIITLEFLPQT